jgi:hypothetical protein
MCVTLRLSLGAAFFNKFALLIWFVVLSDLSVFLLGPYVVRYVPFTEPWESLMV